MTDWLMKRGITEEVLARFSVSTGTHYVLGECIHIPVHDGDGVVAFKKYRRSPFTEQGDKYLYDSGAKAQLYAWHEARKHKRILICEGELDALIAWSNNIPAVSSTGGCMTFTQEWAEWMEDKDVLICYDNDEAGAKGMVRTLGMIPHAKVILLPDMPNVKDITDYCMAGGNLHELLDTAQAITSLEQAQELRGRRVAMFQSTRFYDTYIHNNTPIEYAPRSRSSRDTSNIEQAKEYPITSMLKFNHAHKAVCPWHAEDTPSLHYYAKSNTVYCFGCGKHADAIDVYRAIHGCSFTNAVNALKKL